MSWRIFIHNHRLEQLCHLSVVCLFAVWLVGCSPHWRQQQGRVFFVRSKGDDANSGLAPEEAWRTIARVNAEKFTPGDQIRFEGGHKFNGTLRLDAGDSATARSRLVISSTGKPAIIDGGNQGGLIAYGCHYLTIKKLIFSGAGRKAGNEADGLFITRCRDVKVDSIEVHGFQHSGVLVHICDSVRITHVYAHDNGFAGIHVTGTTIWDSSRYDNHHLYIGHCVAENNPGDPTVTDNHSGNGILASSTEDGVIEYCEAFNNGWDMPWHGNGPVGIWIWDSRNFVIQHCISHDNKSAPDAADGGGFDLDGGTSDSIIQYCLSYDNQGPGIGLFEFGAAKIWQNNTIRYNISQNDGKNGQGSLAIWRGQAGGTIRNCDIYNNTFYNSNPNGPSLCVQNNWQGFRFFNNVFVYNGPFLMAGNKLQDEKFENNCYWNLAESDEFLAYPNIRLWAEATGNEWRDDRFVGIYADPRLFNMGATQLTSPLLLQGNSLPDYRPIAESPLIDAGLNLATSYDLNPGECDIRGKSVPHGKAFDIGAVEYDGE
ncbi:right-handed parallel beta-helix repeat-containing protein [candidate division KSB1 bacterium]|nr:right-handed parallel beta-helix repeat-containing protein [candidate division KSB1 bacterium]